MTDDATERIITSVHCEPLTSARLRVVFTGGRHTTPASVVVEDAAHRRALIGHSTACDVRVDDPAVSRRHASIEIAREGIRLLDLGSRNGTFANGLRVKEVFLMPGDVVTVGSTSLRIELHDDDHPAPAWPSPRFHRVLGASPEMRRLYPLFDKLAQSRSNYLLEGETGTGKELVAETIHDARGVERAPFVVFDPAMFRPEDIERALFEVGPDGGPSPVDQARDGTLYIDEIGDLPAAAQARLLRVIENRTQRGAAALAPVRVVAATRRNLDDAIQERRFREDLYLAIATPRIELPPLRKRSGDVVFLAQCFWTSLGGNAKELSPDLVFRFTQHDWPGNVRELYSAVSLVLVSGGDAFDAKSRVHAVPAPRATDIIADVIARALPFPRARHEVTVELERRYLAAMLEKHGGHIGRAAEASGVGRRYFQMLRSKK